MVDKEIEKLIEISNELLKTKDYEEPLNAFEYFNVEDYPSEMAPLLNEFNKRAKRGNKIYHNALEKEEALINTITSNTWVENYNKKEKINKLTEQYTYLKMVENLTKLFIFSCYVNMEDETYIVMTTSDEVELAGGKQNNIFEYMSYIAEETIEQEFHQRLRDFFNKDKMNRRLKHKDVDALEIVSSLTGLWYRYFIIVGDRNKDGTIKHFIICSSEIDEEKKREEALVRISRTDELTGLYNRRAYDEVLKEKEGATDVAIISADVNELKRVNDNLGHAAGDELIKGAARCLNLAFGNIGQVFRTGGDEFAAIICGDNKKIERGLKKLNRELELFHGKLISSISLSLGYAYRSDFPTKNLEQVAIVADNRMYEDKARYYALKEQNLKDNIS